MRTIDQKSRIVLSPRTNPESETKTYHCFGASKMNKDVGSNKDIAAGKIYIFSKLLIIQ